MRIGIVTEPETQCLSLSLSVSLSLSLMYLRTLDTYWGKRNLTLTSKGFKRHHPAFLIPEPLSAVIMNLLSNCIRSEAWASINSSGRPPQGALRLPRPQGASRWAHREYSGFRRRRRRRRRLPWWLWRWRRWRRRRPRLATQRWSQASSDSVICRTLILVNAWCVDLVKLNSERLGIR